MKLARGGDGISSGGESVMSRKDLVDDDDSDEDDDELLGKDDSSDLRKSFGERRSNVGRNSVKGGHLA